MPYQIDNLGDFPRTAWKLSTRYQVDIYGREVRLKGKHEAFVSGVAVFVLRIPMSHSRAQLMMWIEKA